MLKGFYKFNAVINFSFLGNDEKRADSFPLLKTIEGSDKIAKTIV